MYYRKYGDYIYGECDNYEVEDNLVGCFIAHPNSKHRDVTPRRTSMAYWKEACKEVSLAVFHRHKENRIFWPWGDTPLMPEAPKWAYKFVDVYRHSGTAYSETTRENSVEKGRRGWDWSSCELLWTLDWAKQEEIQKEAARLKKEAPKRKKADIIEQLVNDAFRNDLMWLDLYVNGECLSEEEFLEHMGQTFDEWYEDVHGEPYTD